MEVTLDYAEAHFSHLLQQVALGEEVLLRQDGVAVARIVPVKSSSPLTRPLVDERTSAPRSLERRIICGIGRSRHAGTRIALKLDTLYRFPFNPSRTFFGSASTTS